MRGPSRCLLLVAILAAFAFAGCIDEDPPGNIRDFEAIPNDAGNEVGEGDYDLNLRVVAEHADGTPIANAPILIYHIPKPVTPPTTGMLRAGNATYAVRTDANGLAIAHLGNGRTYSFLATSEGFTEEFRHLKRMDAGIKERTLVVVLYNETKTVEFSGTLMTTPKKLEKLPCPDPCVLGGNVGPADTWLREVQFHPLPDERLNREYVARLAEFKATVTWENTPSAYADLGVRAGFPPGFEFMWEEDAKSELVGPSQESFTIVHKFLEEPTTKKNPKFVAGPITRMPIVAPGGLPYTVKIEAQFSSDANRDCEREYCYSPHSVYEPGFEAFAAGAAVAGAAWWAQRRRLRRD